MTNTNPFSNTSGKKLVRSRNQRMVAGVCGGIGEYFDIDPTLIRLGLVALTVFTGGTGLIAYVIGWVLIPEADAAGQAPAQPEQGRTESDIASRIYADDNPSKPAA